MLSWATVAQTINDFVFPIPANNLEIFWVLLGIQFGGSFGSKLDQEIQESEWFKALDPWKAGFIKRLLDFLHHWWVGGFLWLYSEQVAVKLGLVNYSTEVMFFGLGILIDDVRDVKNLKRRYGIGENSNNGTG